MKNNQPRYCSGKPVKKRMNAKHGKPSDYKHSIRGHAWETPTAYIDDKLVRGIRKCAACGFVPQTQRKALEV